MIEKACVRLRDRNSEFRESVRESERERESMSLS